MFRKLLSIALLLALLPIAALAKTVNIYHTSDTHGFYFPRAIEGKQIGGFAALAALLDSDESHYLLLDSGDWASGTAEAKAGKGALSVQFMNKLNYNATTIGNHDFDFGDEALLANIRKAKFDIIAANVFDSKTKTYPAGVKPFKVYLVDGKKIAVIGIGLDINNNSPLLQVTKGRKELKKALYEVKKQNPDAIVLLAHMSLGAAKYHSASDPSPLKLIEGLEGINLFLGGHKHKIIEGEKAGGVVFSEPGTELLGVSKIKLDFDDTTGKLKDIKSEYIKLDISKTGEDPYIKEFAEANRNASLDIVISKANEALFKLNPAADKGIIDSPLGNIFADLQKEYAGADIGLVNTGNVRGDIPKGDITKRLVEQISPFPNKVMAVKVNGAFLQKLAKTSFKGDRSLFQYSGMEVIYTPQGKVLSIKINGAPLDEKKMYTVATNDYIAKGGAEGYMFKKIQDKNLHGNKTVTELFIDSLKANPQGIFAPATGRITIKK